MTNDEWREHALYISGEIAGLALSIPEAFFRLAADSEHLRPEYREVIEAIIDVRRVASGKGKSSGSGP